MQAVVVEELGKVAVRDDVETAPMGANQVRIKMRASGICRTDLSASNGTWPTRLPAILGHEGAGELLEVGSAVTSMAVGDRVILANLRGCGQCYFCLRAQPFLCGHEEQKGAAKHNFFVAGQPAFGLVGLGAWTEELILPESSVVPFVGDDIPFRIASLVNCAVMTGVGAVIGTAKVEPGSSVVIVGAGGVGAAAVQGARLAGAGLIVVVDPVESKFPRLRHFGATHTVTPDALADTKQDLTRGIGFDYAFENVGRQETLRAAWDATRIGGTVVLSGVGSESTPTDLNLYEITMDAKRLVGSVGGSVNPLRDYQTYLDLWQTGQLDLEGLITSTITLAEAPEAMQELDRGADISRQVILFE
ncbi:zinc-binding dehydrogenase [Sciscionella marina]|uniref:zinc-binding dehydrogenase n=1 Tax=Sciscionella marina TaxID=508770 RepID=UPI00037635E3|nr:zinc-binding dehydrogenase [Sciscionella marina]